MNVIVLPIVLLLISVVQADKITFPEKLQFFLARSFIKECKAASVSQETLTMAFEVIKNKFNKTSSHTPDKQHTDQEKETPEAVLWNEAKQEVFQHTKDATQKKAIATCLSAHEKNAAVIVARGHVVGFYYDLYMEGQRLKVDEHALEDIIKIMDDHKFCQSSEEKALCGLTEEEIKSTKGEIEKQWEDVKTASLAKHTSKNVKELFTKMDATLKHRLDGAAEQCSESKSS